MARFRSSVMESPQFRIEGGRGRRGDSGLESATLKQPTGTEAPTARRITPFPTCGSTPWTLGPIIVADGALVRSRTSLIANHASTLPVG